MKIVTVIPFSRGIHKESLTYFTAKDIPVGTIVTVPVRKKLVESFVVETKDLLASKSDIKTSAFNLKKVKSIKGPSFLRPEFFKATSKASRYFATYPGLVLNSLVPTTFIKTGLTPSRIYPVLSRQPAPLRLARPGKAGRGGASAEKGKLRQEKLILQKSFEDRLSFYKTFIRGSFAKKQSVFLCLPTINEIRRFSEALKKGIENYVFVLHSDLSTKDQVAKYNKIMEEEHPVLIVATGSYLFIPRDDIGTIIVEREGSGAYKMIQRPFIDIRMFAELFSYEIKAKLIFADTLLRTETLWRHDRNELAEITPITFRLPSLVKQEIVSMTKEPQKESEAPYGAQQKDRETEEQKFKVLSEKVKKIIKETIENGEQIFLFTLRKGLAPVTVCNDCGTTLLCSSCATPMTLYQRNLSRGSEVTLRDKRTEKQKNREIRERIFRCNRCREQKSAKTVCAECGSWNLVPLGIGIERVVDELEGFPALFRIDQESVKTRKQAEGVIKEFYNTPGSVLVGTEMALSYLQDKVKNTAIISFDSLFSIPSFHINEKIIQLLLKLLSHTEKKLIIQTRNPEELVLKHISSGNLIEFYREELEQRKEFNYPPFSTLIKITFAGNKRDSDKAVKTMGELFSNYKPEIFKAYIPRIKNRYITNMVIKLNPAISNLPAGKAGRAGRSKWPDDTLLQKLYSLPPTYTIQVDPEDLL